VNAEPQSSPKRGAVYVAPNRNALGLVAVLLAMFYVGMGQGNGSAYLLCFLIGGIAAVSLLHAWVNLRGISVKAGSIRAVFAGEKIAVPLRITAPNGRRHAGISASANGGGGVLFPDEITPDSPGHLEVLAPARERGSYHQLKVTLASLYPLGFFTARRTFLEPATHYVYPKPEGNLPLPVEFDPTRQTAMEARIEGDDFAGVREWQTGESMRHVDWKAAARGHRLMIKQWRGTAGGLFLILDWLQLERLAPEERLSQLARWALLAEHNGATYGLRLPGVTVAAGSGEAHLHACLRTLAAFDTASADPIEEMEATR
jgi:uncharacterized protein (DUF58 family)